MSKTLPVLISEYNELIKQIEENSGLLTPELENDLNNLNQLLPAKVDQYIFVMDKLDDDADFFKKKAEQYLEVSKRLNNTQENIKNRIKYFMQTNKIYEISGEYDVFKLVKSKPKLFIDESKLDDSFKMITQDVVPDKEMISQYLKDGLPVIGATLDESYSLRITKKKGT